MKKSALLLALFAAFLLAATSSNAQRKADGTDIKAAITACSACIKLGSGDPLTDLESMIVKNLGPDYCDASPCDLKPIKAGDQLTQPQASQLNAYRQALGMPPAEDVSDTPTSPTKPTPPTKPTNPTNPNPPTNPPTNPSNPNTPPPPKTKPATPPPPPGGGNQAVSKTDQQILTIARLICSKPANALSEAEKRMKVWLSENDSECLQVAEWLGEVNTKKPLSTEAKAAVQALRDAYEGK